MEEVKENCGLCVAHTLHDAYSMAKSLQHRGREAAGIAAISDNRIDVLKWKGNVDTFDITDLHKIFPGHNYHTYMAHVRYATRGRKDKILEDAHPHTVGGKVEHQGDHVLVLDCDAAIIHNGQINPEYLGEVDKKLLKTECDSEAFLYYFMSKGEIEILKNIPGSYTAAIADKRKKGIVVLRDKGGIKPGCLFWKDDRYGIASEEIAPRKNGGEFIEDLLPGAVYYLYPNAKQPTPMKVVEPNLAYCFFEWNYIADIDSIINGLSVRRARQELGIAIAREFQFDIDLISYVPRCPEVAARSCAKEKGMEDKFIPIFYKMRGERSFLGSTSEDREDSIDHNLYLIPGVEEKLKGLILLVLDDSFIRGNVLRKISKLMKNIEAKRIYVASYTPPIGIVGEDGVKRGCSCGVDMPHDDKFLIRDETGVKNRTPEEINKDYGGKIQVVYLSLEGMFKAYENVGMPRENLESFCIGGQNSFCNSSCRK